MNKWIGNKEINVNGEYLSHLRFFRQHSTEILNELLQMLNDLKIESEEIRIANKLGEDKDDVQYRNKSTTSDDRRPNI